MTKFDSEEEICDDNSCFAFGTSFYMKLNFPNYWITLSDLQVGSSNSWALEKLSFNVQPWSWVMTSFWKKPSSFQNLESFAFWFISYINWIITITSIQLWDPQKDWWTNWFCYGVKNFIIYVKVEQDSLWDEQYLENFLLLALQNLHSKSMQIIAH